MHFMQNFFVVEKMEGNAYIKIKNYSGASLWAPTRGASTRNLATEEEMFVFLIIGDGAIRQSTVRPGETSTRFLSDFNNLCLIHFNP